MCEHTHDHEHPHEHHHGHASAEETLALLTYMLGHNRHHAEELHELGEMIAENTHEVWSLGRVNDGWTYGPKRDDTLKQHPCLVPYPDLPESEKEYDRNTALETIKAIIALGYKITK